ncbi:MAG: tRNA (adenosine(37)-N6)-threonylcarbamoyltransferase complex dimerization subunit type 1 TsaB [Lachnospiraceae bacterium]
MKILAIESATMVASVALISDETLLAEYTVNHKKTHSQTLLSMIDEIVSMIEMPLEDLDAIAVSGGPGSFTGLRIGSATGKGLGLALNKPLIHIPTLEAMAYQFCGTDYVICPMMDARRQQVYSGIYKCDKDIEVLYDQSIEQIEDVIERLNNMGSKVILLGDGAQVNKKYIMDNLKAEYLFAPAHMNRNKASSVAGLALKYFAKGKIENAREHLPNYLRASQAERELEEKMSNEAK